MGNDVLAEAIHVQQHRTQKLARWKRLLQTRWGQNHHLTLSKPISRNLPIPSRKWLPLDFFSTIFPNEGIQFSSDSEQQIEKLFTAHRTQHEFRREYSKWIPWELSSRRSLTFTYRHYHRHVLYLPRPCTIILQKRDRAAWLDLSPAKERITVSTITKVSPSHRQGREASNDMISSLVSVLVIIFHSGKWAKSGSDCPPICHLNSSRHSKYLNWVDWWVFRPITLFRSTFLVPATSNWTWWYDVHGIGVKIGVPLFSLHYFQDPRRII